jgi:hypothetical protein
MARRIFSREFKVEAFHLVKRVLCTLHYGCGLGEHDACEGCDMQAR